MKKKWIVLAALILVAGSLIALKYLRPSETSKPAASSPDVSKSQPEVPRPVSTASAPVPAHYENPPGTLSPTLAPGKFTGKTRQAYQAAKDIPQTLAQLPCYCYCDRGMGHKSLHSCFEDDHAAHCDVCVNESIMASELQKKGLTPAQIREQIIGRYSRQ